MKIRCLVIAFFIFFVCSIQSFAQSDEELTSPYTYYKQGKYRSAIRRAEQLIQEGKENISAYAVKGWSHLSLRQWNDALNIANAAYAINKTDRRIIQILGEVHYELGNYDTSLKFLEKYLAIASKDGKLRNWVYYFLGMIYVKKDKLYKADAALTTAIEFDKQDNKVPHIDWLVQLANVKEKRQRPQEALKTYQYILSLDSQNTIARKAITRLSS